MIALLQRVRGAHVDIAGQRVATIGPGVLAMVGVVRTDGPSQAERLLRRILGYRLFADAGGRMNLSVRDIGGGLLLVPQFTLAADTDKGMRASFVPAAAPEDGRRLFEYLLAAARRQYGQVESGVFGVDMQVALINDGPVTFWIEG